MTVDDETIEAWHFAFQDENANEVFHAVRYLFKTQPDSFAPNPSLIFGAMKELRSPQIDSAEIAWAQGPRQVRSPHDAEIWRLWGGATRWGGLPDPKYREDPLQATRELNFARKEFVDLYNSKTEFDRNEPERLTHQRAIEALGAVKKTTGIDLMMEELLEGIAWTEE